MKQQFHCQFRSWRDAIHVAASWMPNLKGDATAPLSIPGTHLLQNLCSFSGHNGSCNSFTVNSGCDRWCNSYSGHKGCCNTPLSVPGSKGDIVDPPSNPVTKSDAKLHCQDQSHMVILLLQNLARKGYTSASMLKKAFQAYFIALKLKYNPAWLGFTLDVSWNNRLFKNVYPISMIHSFFLRLSGFCACSFPFLLHDHWLVILQNNFQ